MVEKPANVPPPQPSESQKNVGQTDKSTPGTGAFSTSGMPQPFPNMTMNEKQKKQFWNTMMQQMNTVINKNTEKARKALKKLRDSEA